MESTIIREFNGRVVFIRFIVAPLVFHAVTFLDKELAHIENGDLESELPGSLIELMREEV